MMHRAHTHRVHTHRAHTHRAHTHRAHTHRAHTHRAHKCVHDTCTFTQYGSSCSHRCVVPLDHLAAAAAVNAVLATGKSRPKPLTAKQRLGKIMRLGKNWKK